MVMIHSIGVLRIPLLLAPDWKEICIEIFLPQVSVICKSLYVKVCTVSKERPCSNGSCPWIAKKHNALMLDE